MENIFNQNFTFKSFPETRKERKRERERTHMRKHTQRERERESKPRKPKIVAPLARSSNPRSLNPKNPRSSNPRLSHREPTNCESHRADRTGKSHCYRSHSCSWPKAHWHRRSHRLDLIAPMISSSRSHRRLSFPEVFDHSLFLPLSIWPNLYEECGSFEQIYVSLKCIYWNFCNKICLWFWFFTFSLWSLILLLLLWWCGWWCFGDFPVVWWWVLCGWQ